MSSLPQLFLSVKNMIFYDPIFFHISIAPKYIRNLCYMKIMLLKHFFLFLNILVKKYVVFASRPQRGYLRGDAEEILIFDWS